MDLDSGVDTCKQPNPEPVGSENVCWYCLYFHLEYYLLECLLNDYLHCTDCCYILGWLTTTWNKQNSPRAFITFPGLVCHTIATIVASWDRWNQFFRTWEEVDETLIASFSCGALLQYLAYLMLTVIIFFRLIYHNNKTKDISVNSSHSLATFAIVETCTLAQNNKRFHWFRCLLLAVLYIFLGCCNALIAYFICFTINSCYMR